MNQKSITESVCDNIRLIRINKGFKQAQMARLLEMHQGTYNKIENNKTVISLDLLEKISEILDVSVINIIEYQKKRNPSGTNITEKLEELIETINSTKDRHNNEQDNLLILTLLKEYSKVLRGIKLK